MQPRLPLAAMLLWLCLTVQAEAQSARTANFIVSGPDAAVIAAKCEDDRQFLANMLFGREQPQWSEPCLVTVTNQGGGSTGGGATSFGFSNGRAFGFEGSWKGTREQLLNNVVPHEVLHTVLATHFGSRLPRWYDEGFCCVVEAHPMQKLYHDQCVQALMNGRGIAFNRMFAMMEYPRDIGAFYAQAHSVARFLMMQKGPREFVRYGEIGLRNGWTVAGQQVYGYRDLSDLQAQWNDWLAGRRQLVAKWTFVQGRGWIQCQPAPPMTSIAPRTQPSTGPITQPAPCPTQTQTINLDQLLSKLAADPRFRGPPGKDGEDGKDGSNGTDGGVAEINYERLAEMILARMQANPEPFKGPPGEPGSPGTNPEVDYGKLADSLKKKLPPITVELEQQDGSRETRSVELGGTLVIPKENRQLFYQIVPRK